MNEDIAQLQMRMNVKNLRLLVGVMDVSTHMDPSTVFIVMVSQYTTTLTSQV